MKTRITEMLGIEHPIVQAGMSWASSSAALPATVSNEGGLGVIAAGPMYVEAFKGVLDEMSALTSKPFAVNIPLYRPQVDDILNVMYEHRVPVIIASQGGPKAHLPRFREYGAKWIHVVSTLEHALKAEAAGVDALVVVGAEAGGHPPVSGVSTLVTVRQVLREVSIPVIAGGGVADGWGIAALLALGADAVQLGTRFLVTPEATVHAAYKEAVLNARAADAVLVGRRSLPVRALNNAFTEAIFDAEQRDVSKEEYEALFKKSTLKQAALDGDVAWGKVEAGQSAGLVKTLEPAGELMRTLVRELEDACGRMEAMARRTALA
ncbi:NAD(P)H-dependent flavin oxidoreductase [Ottowia thiooxydans]|uniref:NAD(P)H-dependent flavin oxidoreductase n=1 Tax=Ottowia thiooxydans TaxID=219182 RepID=UPI00041E25B3|nr:nitronate monooxygenase [Ottowia thiooxydans]